MLVCLNLLSSELHISNMPNFEGIIICPFHVKKAFGGGGGDHAKSPRQSTAQLHSSVHDEGVWGLMRDCHICE
jgi:hypothetical protein